MAKIISFANHKGGVAKTTLAVSVSDAMARAGYDVLLVDLDPQSNATQLVYSFEETPSVTIERVLDGTASIASAIVEKTQIDGVHLIGSTLKLASLERQLQQTPFASTSVLASKLAAVADAYDVIVIDTPPSLSFLTANALAAANAVFVPVESGSKLALLGTDDMLAFIRQAKGANPALLLGGAILTRHDARKKMCKITANAVREYYEAVLNSALPATTDIQKAQALGQTILQFDRDHNASRAISEMTKEIINVVGVTRTQEEEVTNG
ncbi:ParA family protein [Azoarcus sp. KH32C]|uniref:ParA family protein n=1 Tax=Azoarcus sp. KH32C TaxID=748247 RepID=UPI0002385BBD|nr:ParA family protein [Azoarcus sp. KH32C]BAL27312.1 putative chromosome partitioning protein, ParA family [Azoarcus sp. KH32C]